MASTNWIATAEKDNLSVAEKALKELKKRLPKKMRTILVCNMPKTWIEIDAKTPDDVVREKVAKWKLHFEKSGNTSV